MLASGRARLADLIADEAANSGAPYSYYGTVAKQCSSDPTAYSANGRIPLLASTHASVSN